MPRPGTDDKRNDSGGANEGDRPGDRLGQQRGNFGRVLGYVGPEVQVDDIVEVVDVLVPQRTGMAHPEHGLERLVGRWLKVRELRHDVFDCVAWHQTRYEEVDGEGHPGGNSVKHQPADDEPHKRSTLYLPCVLSSSSARSPLHHPLSLLAMGRPQGKSPKRAAGAYSASWRTSWRAVAPCHE